MCGDVEGIVHVKITLNTIEVKFLRSNMIMNVNHSEEYKAPWTCNT